MLATMRTGAAAAAAFIGCLMAPLAGAQTPGPDSASIWTLQDENASISAAALSDRYYTNGIRLGWVSREGGAPDSLENLGRTLWGDGRMRIGLDLSQRIFTADDTISGNPPPTDRPFAGVLLATASLLHDDAAGARSVLAVALGMVGPSALGETTQNNFHDLIGQKKVEGWNTQLHDEPVFQFLGERTWRLPVARFGGIETDALPSLTGAAGTLRVYGQTGVIFRLGQGLDADYGVARMRPAPTGTDVFRPTRSFAWYVFAGADEQAVGYDVTLEGNLWQDSRSVKLQPLVSELEAGLALMISGVRLTYTQALRSQEFKHQQGGLHQFGSLALSVRF